MSESYGGNYQFLTILGLCFAMATFIVAALADLTLSPQLFAAKNALSTFSTPLEVLISVLYWGLCAIDKTLVIPPDMSLDFLPDFGLHAAPAIFLALDMLLLSPPWAIRGYTAMALSQMLAFAYWYWVELCFSKNGWLVRPLYLDCHVPSATVILSSICPGILIPSLTSYRSRSGPCSSLCLLSS